MNLNPYVDKRIDRSGDCWLWIGSLDGCGYAIHRFNGRTRKIHRYVWEEANGAVPSGLELDHLCRVRHCVNPQHMEPVTHRENVLRGESPSAKAAQQEQCSKGHPFDCHDGRARCCRTCQREKNRRSYRKRVKGL